MMLNIIAVTLYSSSIIIELLKKLEINKQKIDIDKKTEMNEK